MGSVCNAPHKVWCMMHLSVQLHLYFTCIQKVWVNEPKCVAKRTKNVVKRVCECGYVPPLYLLCLTATDHTFDNLNA